MEMNWIPVSERLPEQPKNWIDEYGKEWSKPSDDFIITDDKGRVYIAGYTFCEKRFWYNYSLNKVNAVAWMPLPKPYGEESKAAASSDVNHPSHYNIAGRKECIVEMLEIFGVEKTKAFCELNAYKYRYRAGLKGDAEKDFAKADWYEDYSKSLEEQHDKD